MTAQTQDYVDPFAGGDKAPALSFPTVGTSYTGTITEPPKLLQSKNFNTGELDFWPGQNGQPGNPKMCAVINLEVDGEPYSVWAQKPSALFVALKEAQKVAGKPFEVGGTLAIKYTGDEPHTDPEKIRKRLPAKKLYAAKYTPPAPPAPTDPFGDESPPF